VQAELRGPFGCIIRPVSVPEGQSMNAAVLDFSGVHRMIRGFIAKIDTALENPSSDASWGKTLAGLVLFGVAGLRFHHHVEDDEYWPAVVKKGADAHLLEPLQAQHKELDSLLDRLEAQAKRLAGAPADASALAGVTALIVQFGDHVRAHLDQEEPIMFPMLEQYISDPEAHAIATRVARSAPKKGISWIMGGATYAMTPAETTNFLSAFPKPIIWMRPLLLRTYRRNCATLRLEPQFS
jgi:hemerythrin-like domain-containing protein